MFTHSFSMPAHIRRVAFFYVFTGGESAPVSSSRRFIVAGIRKTSSASATASTQSGAAIRSRSPSELKRANERRACKN